MAIIIAYIESHKNKLIDELCAEYVKKTQGSFAMKLLKLESSKVTIPEKQQELETQSLLSKLKPGDKLILCDETGNSYSSPAFSKFLSKQLSESRGNIFIAIGGAYGFSRSVLEQYPKIKNFAENAKRDRYNTCNRHKPLNHVAILLKLQN